MDCCGAVLPRCLKYASVMLRHGLGLHLKDRSHGPKDTVLTFIDHFKITSIIRDMEQNSASYLITVADMHHIQGKIQPVLACGRLTVALDKDLVVLTGDKLYTREVDRARGNSINKAAASGSQGYQVRQLLSPITAPTTAAGWGTFERPDLLQLRVDGEGYLVNALQISTQIKIDYRNLCGSLASEYGHSVTDVLFVEPVDS